MFALWTWAGRVVGRAPGVPGDRETLTLALPVGVEGALEPAEVDARLVEVASLGDLTVEAAGESVARWRDAVRATDLPAGTDGTTPPLPLAAHAVPNASGTAIVSADHAYRVLRATEAVAAELGPSLQAQLRPYQARGTAWLREAVQTHGGAVLADEMGLGKTVQAIGFLLGRAETEPQLVVCPTSLVGNWTHEIGRFAPGLRPAVWRGGKIPDDPGTVAVVGYPTLRIHAATLAGQRWRTVIFDEAQALKNPRTQISKAARALDGAAKVALTGTPVENHLDELWALVNLVSPGALGHRAQFRRRFVQPVREGSVAAAARLRDTIEPIVLARKKVQVAASLPPKIHNNLLCDLTAEQEEIYDALLAEAVDDGFGAGIERHGHVLAVLTALKQVCNHPGLITGEMDSLTGRSGKLDLCTDIVATNMETGSPTLIFTQYRRTGEMLVRHLAEEFDVVAPFLHGGLPQSERAEIVSRFQSEDGPPVLVLSLRAAGTGLTLTRAADVVHFDRWWNPAVEAQASDRAHRIGQTLTVTVTTLTSTTTVEEHIAGMHGRKAALTDLEDAAGIAALAGLDDDQLIEILRRKREK